MWISERRSPTPVVTSVPTLSINQSINNQHKYLEYAVSRDSAMSNISNERGLWGCG